MMQETEQRMGIQERFLILHLRRIHSSGHDRCDTRQFRIACRVDVECHTDRRAAVCTEMTGNGSSMKLHQYRPYRVISLAQADHRASGWIGRTGLPEQTGPRDVPDSLEYRFLRRLKKPMGAMAAGRWTSPENRGQIIISR